MEVLIVVVVLLLATVVLVSVGEKVGLPWPVLLTLVTGVLIVIPQVPSIYVNPEIILPIFLPPLLWAIGQKVSWGMLRRSWRSVAFYSLALTAVTAFVVGAATWLIVPGITVALALAIGAAVAPPDPVAVEAVAEPVGIPRRIIANLQTEGIFNDAVSLVLFQVALAAIEAGTDPRADTIAIAFVYSAAIAVALGLAVGCAGAALRRNLSDSVGRNALTLAIPFAVYMIAEELHASGVIAVVIASIHMASSVGDLSAEERLASHAFWNVLELLATGLAFGLIGLQAGELLDEADASVLITIGHGVLISAVVIGVRLAWMTGIWLWGRDQGERRVAPRSFAEVLVMTWAGMRGLVTLSLVLALPEMAGGMRTEAVFIMLTVLFFTMVFPGLTLPFLVRKLGVDAHAEKDDHEEEELLAIARRAMWKSTYDSVIESGNVEAIDRVRGIVSGLMDQLNEERGEEDVHRRLVRAREQREIMRLARRKAVLAAQAAVLEARNRYDPEIVSQVLYQIDVQVQFEEAHSGGDAFVLTPPKITSTTDTTGMRESMETFFARAEKRIAQAQAEMKAQKTALEEEIEDEDTADAAPPEDEHGDQGGTAGSA